MNDHFRGVRNMISDTPRTDALWERFGTEEGLEPDVEFSTLSRQLERELHSALSEIRSLKYNYDRVIGMYSAKDSQICNMLNICRANGIDVSSQDLINGKEDKL